MANIGFPLALLLTFSLLSACSDFESDCNPDNCYEKKLNNAEIEILSSINSLNNYVVIKIYNGNVEEGKEIKTITVNETSSYYTLPTRGRLSAVAYYQTVKGDLEVYNSIKPKYRFADCDYTCYNLQDGILDMRIK